MCLIVDCFMFAISLITVSQLVLEDEYVCTYVFFNRNIIETTCVQNVGTYLLYIISSYSHRRPIHEFLVRRALIQYPLIVIIYFLIEGFAHAEGN